MQGISRKHAGHDVYGLIKSLKDRDHLLGKRWYVCTLSKVLDFSYVNVDTIKFYIREWKIEEPDPEDAKMQQCTRSTVLIF